MGYRQGAPKHGIINPIKIPAHKECKCKTPGWFGRWFGSVVKGSLYRCDRCGQIWEWIAGAEMGSIGPDSYSMWVKSDLQAWKNAGGNE